MPFGKKDQDQPSVWRIHSKRNWKLVRETPGSYFLAGCSQTSNGQLDMIVEIGKSTGKVVDRKTSWNSLSMQQNEPDPHPEKIGDVVMSRGIKQNTLNL